MLGRDIPLWAAQQDDDAPPFVDTFERTDGAIGKGWVGASWSITSGAVKNTLDVGDEMLLNPGAEGAYVAGVAPDWGKSGTPTVSEENAHVLDGASAQKMVADAQSEGVYANGPNVVAGHYYIFDGGVDTTGNTNFKDRNSRLVNFSQAILNTSGEYLRLICMGYALSTGSTQPAVLQNSATSATIYADRWSFREFTYSSLFMTRHYDQRDIIADTTLTYVAGRAGIVVALDNPNNPQNYVAVYFRDGSLIISKFLARTETVLATTTKTHIPGEILSVRRTGNTFQVWYAKAQVGSDQVISDAAIINNRYVGLYSNADSTFGGFRICRPGDLYPFSGFSGLYQSAIYPAGKAVLSLRFDDGNKKDYTIVYPLLVARGLVAGFSIIRSYMNTGMTISQCLELQAAGMEMIGHGGGVDPANDAAFVLATAGDTETLRFMGLKIDLFVQPGTWVGQYRIDYAAFFDLHEGKVLQRYYAACIAEVYNYYRSLPVPAERRWGAYYFGATASTPAELEAMVDYIIANHIGLELLFHPAHFDTPGYITSADFAVFLDYVAAKVAAGDIVIMTPTQHLFAQPVTP